MHQQAVTQPPKVSSHLTSCPSQHSDLINTLAIFHRDLITDHKLMGCRVTAPFSPCWRSPSRASCPMSPGHMCLPAKRPSPVCRYMLRRR